MCATADADGCDAPDSPDRQAWHRGHVRTVGEVDPFPTSRLVQFAFGTTVGAPSGFGPIATSATCTTSPGYSRPAVDPAAAKRGGRARHVQPLAGFLIAYDIGNDRRLARVAACLERHAVRCQKSVFLFDGNGPALAALLDELTSMIDPAVNALEAWPIARLPSGHRLIRGRSSRAASDAAVIGGGALLLAGRPSST